jgi:2-polyprenyl-6-hydroxyphenyl methylase/3-demethylubiquinone-9 3-methyltransferase
VHATPYTGIAGRIQRARVAAIVRLAEIRAGDAVLEIGCEAGHLMAAVPRCRRLVGVDVSGAALADARARLAGRAGVELVQLDAQRHLPFRPGELDVVICSEMLEHVSEPRAVIERIAEIAAPDTRIVISVPVEAPKVAVKRLLSALGVFERLFPGVETGQSEWHLHAFSRNALLDCARGLLRLERGAYVWGCHYVALFRKT